MAEYKISVIVPVYNVESYLNRAMDSLRGQTIGFDSLQIIFADDCSIDRSGEMVDHFAEVYPNVTALRLVKNSGAAGIPRNMAMQSASADFVMFLDPDDFYAPDACETLYNYMMNTDVDFVCGYFSQISEYGELIEEKPDAYKGLTEGIYALPEAIEDAISISSMFCAKIYRRSIISRYEISFPEYIPGQDTVFYLHYLLKSGSFAYVDKQIISYTLRDGENKSISFTLTKRYFIGINTCYKLCEELFKQNGFEEYFRHVVSNAVSFYFNKLLDAYLPDSDVLDILEEWRWLCVYYDEHKISVLSEYSDILFRCILSNRLCDVLDIFNRLKALRIYTQELEDAKVYFLGQLECKDKALSEAEDAKTYFLRQLDNYIEVAAEAKKDLDRQSKVLSEAEHAKAYLLGQLDNHIKAIEEVKEALNIQSKAFAEVEAEKVVLLSQLENQNKIIESISADLAEAYAQPLHRWIQKKYQKI